MSICSLVSGVRIEQQTLSALGSMGLGKQHPVPPRDRAEEGEQEVTNAAVGTPPYKERNDTLSRSRVDSQHMATRFNKPSTVDVRP